MNSLSAKTPQVCLKFKMGNLVRIIKEKVTFVKVYEQTEILRVVKVIQRMPKPVYELSDLQVRPIEGQFYIYERVKVAVTRLQTVPVIFSKQQNSQF
jgi:hypothetical protein